MAVEEKTRAPATLPPLPWDWVASEKPDGRGQFHAYLVDATGRKIAAIWGRGAEKTLIADTILALVNGSDALKIQKRNGEA